MYLVVSTSLSQVSRSRTLARRALSLLGGMAGTAESVDLASYSLPMDDGSRTVASDPEVREIERLVGRAVGVIVVTPIYNADVAIAARNLIQLTGPAWQRKVVGFACVAGGPVSYTAVLGLANNLMLEYRAFVLPDFVFADSQAFSDDGGLLDNTVDENLQRLSRTLIRVTEALKTA